MFGVKVYLFLTDENLKLFGVNYCLYPNNFQTFQTFESFVEKSSSTFFVGKFEFRTPEKVIDANISKLLHPGENFACRRKSLRMFVVGKVLESFRLQVVDV